MTSTTSLDCTCYRQTVLEVAGGSVIGLRIDLLENISL